MDDHRLERMESRLDQIAEAIVKLAVMEERLLVLYNRSDNTDSRLNEQSQRIRTLEEISSTRGSYFGVLERAFWIITASAVGTLFWYFRG